MELDEWLTANLSPNTATETVPPVQTTATKWTEIRLFLSSTFIDTQAERDVIIKRVIPNINRKLSPRFIRLNPVDLRWGVLSDESSSCFAIQKTCLNQIDRCRQKVGESPWFLGLRTERYGWVQDKVKGSDGFEQPQYYDWIDKFKDCGKHISITSLECIHASQTPSYACNEPTVFFFKRVIDNPTDVEEGMEWVFDFEHVAMDKELKGDDEYQYLRSEKAEEYQSDREKLDCFLKTLPHVKYSTYNCTYKEGGARYTCENKGKKSYGIGYVDDLEDFEQQVENHLLQAVERNFLEPDLSAIPNHVVETIQHEGAMKTKAATFVGRTELVATCFSHCSSDVENSVMLVHGEPGCGKSGLMATLAQKCLDSMGEQHFVFVHGVDCCPNSNMIELMLKRLHLNLQDYLAKLNGTTASLDLQNDSSKPGEIDVNSPSELKVKHLKALYAAASAHPGKWFVVIVDAANQFSDHLLAWKMWWLPNAEAPPNLRFVVSTLNHQNGTFENACHRCPTAVLIPVENMSYKDRQEMVATVLRKYNKKLTVDDENELLGNQMESLLKKNTSPLYLIAATEALRTFGVFEEVSKYIEKLPDETDLLFGFLLNEWVQDHGEELIKDVMSLICVSKDGHLENQINDILLRKEDEDQKSLIYESSFSRLYDSLINFLASGGGGFLRFFHDQLKQVVYEKFLMTDTERRNAHKWIAQFFHDCIAPQLCHEPANDPDKAYYEDCLDTIVFHQLAILSEQEDIAILEKTLRNIYFVRERFVAKQQQTLKREYLEAMKLCNNMDINCTPLKHWYKFVQLYAPYIIQFPQFAYSMAANQSPSSYVSMDTLVLDAPALKQDTGFPLYWKNISSAADAALVKYTRESCTACVASSHEQNVTIIGTAEGINKQKLLIFEQDSGNLVNQMEVRVTSLYLPPSCNVVWVGDKKGFLTVYSVDSTAELCKVLVGDQEKVEDEVIWIQDINEEQVVCGTAWGSITIFSMQNPKILTKWLLRHVSQSCYNFQKSRELIFSGQDKDIIVWGVDGSCVKSCTGVGVDREYVDCISPHPMDVPKTLYVTRTWRKSKFRLHEWDLETNVHREVSSAVGDQAQYLGLGNRILCKGPSQKSLRILDLDGNILNKIKGHSKVISSFYLLSDVEVLTAAGDGSILFELPRTPAEDLKQYQEQVKWCHFLNNGDEFATLSDDGQVSVWTTSTCNVRSSLQLKEVANNRPCAAVSPDGKYICVGTLTMLFWISCASVEVAFSHRSIYRLYSGNLALKSMGFTPDGRNLVLLEEDNKSVLLLDVSDMGKRNKMKAAYTMEKRINWYDVHSDGIQAMTAAGHDVHIWNLLTGEPLYQLKTNLNTSMGKFIGGKDLLLFKTSDTLGLMNLQGETTVRLTTSKSVHGFVVVGEGGRVVVSDGNGTLRIFATSSGEELYAFFEHRSEGFPHFDVDPKSNTVVAFNSNGMAYLLKTMLK